MPGKKKGASSARTVSERKVNACVVEAPRKMLVSKGAIEKCLALFSTRVAKKTEAATQNVELAFEGRDQSGSHGRRQKRRLMRAAA